ncbi:AMP-binding protein [Pseudonocardia endophytica]|uniref:Fatty-acyl-CoA synthase n=1 Tax=Pseudonocardia endophytica TaxID=401976 RepID=A0A4R1HXM5_PSEEN|nr:AMP-binding protein [Pseudonocardia endophytica]TCK27544.1 fatty-acyl-CoA synthase [Pseudonocardia endophytica]
MAPGPAPSPTVPPWAAGPSYGDVVVEALTRYPRRDAFVLGERRATYAEIADLVGRTQTVLDELGLRPGGAVGVLSPNAPEVFVVQTAAVLNGARYTGLHPLSSLEDHVFLCDDAEIEVLVVHPVYAERAAAVAERAASVRHVLSLGPSEAGPDLLDRCARTAPRTLRAPDLDQETTAWLQYTGGTTGTPKGAMVPHRALVQLAQSVTNSWGLPEAPVYLAASPITHAAVLPVTAALVRGGTVVLQQGFDPDGWLTAVETERVNFAFVVPTMIYALLEKADPAARDLSSIETLCYGAAPMTPQRLVEAQEVFGPVMLQGYGQSESVGMATSLRKDEHDPVGRPDLLTSCGRPVAGVHIELQGDDGVPVADGEVGEVCIRSRAVMNGYWKRDEESAQALRGGWLRTTDLAVRDAEGFLHLVDRKKDMIITGGFNVYPREIEDVLTGHESVSQAAVVGVPDERWGEAVAAFVVARAGAEIDVAALTALVRERKGPHQAPKRVEIVPELPTTGVGKIDKKALRAVHWAGQTRNVH